MKTAIDRNQLIVLVGGLGVVFVAGGIAWLGLNSLGEKQAEAQALADKMGNPALAALLGEPGGAAKAARDTKEIQKLGTELLANDQTTAGWSRATEKLSGHGQPWAADPGKWKDALISIQSKLQKSARDARVEIAPDFYLGLEAFRQRSPTPEEVPDLALHLSVADWLLSLFLEARKVKEQYPTACEIRALFGPGSGEAKGLQENAEKTGPAPAGKPGSELERKTFRLIFRSSPEVLYEYVQKINREKLPGDDPAIPLFIVTDLSLANTKQIFPLRTEIGKKFASRESTSPAGETVPKKEENKKLLEILAGEEGLDVNLVVDFVAWKNPKDEKGSSLPAQTP